MTPPRVRAPEQSGHAPPPECPPSPARRRALAPRGRLRLAMAAMLALGSKLIILIRTYGLLIANPAVFTAASIPPPAVPATLGAPPAPSDVRPRLLSGGAVEIRWQGCKTGGTSYVLERAVTMAGGQESAFALLGATARRRWLDRTVPPGAALLTYRVRAFRAGGASETSQAVVLALYTIEPMNAATAGSAERAA